MVLKEALDAAISSAQNKRIVEWVGDDRKRFAEVMEFFLNGNLRENQRAAMAVGVVGERHPKLLYPYLEKMLDALEHPNHDAQVRNTLRSLQFIDVPEEHMGRVTNYCFEYLGSPNYPVAFRAFAMTVLYNISVKEPDLMPELKLVIEDVIPHGSAGLKARARNVLAQIEKHLRTAAS